MGNSSATATLPLAEGGHDITATLADNASNTGQAHASFLVVANASLLTITNPQDNSYANNSPIVVTGTVQSADPLVAVKCGDTPAVVDNGNFTCDAALNADGTTTTLTVTATDRAGHVTTKTLRVTLDTVAPDLKITQPANGIFTNASSITVAGTVADSSPVTVSVNGTPATVTGTSFTASVPLAAGDEPITVTATDAAQNSFTAPVVHVYVVRQAPVVAITSPSAAAALRGPMVDVSGTVDVARAESVTPPVTVEVNHTPAVVSGRTFTAQVPAVDGSLTLTAAAIDAAGNVGTSADVTVAIDSVPPVIAITEPVDGAFTKASVLHIAGTVNDTSDVTLLLGTEAVPLAGSAFAVDVPLGSEEPVRFSFHATDAAGNTSDRDLHITVDRTAPTLTVVSPADGAAIGALPVVVQGTVADPALPIVVTVDGSTSAIVSGQSWQATVDSLAQGPHTFTVVATDAAGNQTSPVTRQVVVDLLAPALTITSPANGAVTNAASINVAGTIVATSGATVKVNGVTAVVTGSSFQATGVPLAPGDNQITASATSAAGRPSLTNPSVVVTRDSVAPSVNLTTPDTVTREKPGHATAAPSDNLQVAQVAFTINGQPAGTFTQPPYDVVITVPQSAANGDVLTIVATARDTAGNTASESHGVKVVTAAAITGLVLDDKTGLPLAGASVVILKDGVTPTPVTTDANGRYTLPSSDALAVIRISKDGMTLVERHVSLTTGVGAVPVDARLTLLGTASGDISVPGAASGTVTALSAQGLPGLLPMGWAPLAAVDLQQPGAITVAHLATTNPLTLVRYDLDLHDWSVVSTALTPAGDQTLSVTVLTAGTYAVILPDSAALVAQVGEPLPDAAMATLPDAVLGSAAVNPKTLPPGGGTAAATLSVQSPTALPSGTVLQARVTEPFTLASGKQGAEEERTEDIVLFQQPAPQGAALAGTFPITPSRTFQPTELSTGEVHLAIMSGREGVRGALGGNEAVTLNDEDSLLTIAANSLPEDTDVVLEQAASLSPFLPTSSTATPIAEVVVDFSGQTLAIAAQLSVAAAGASPTDTLLVARVERDNAGVPYLNLAAIAQLQDSRVVTTTMPGLPGITTQGRYVVYRVTVPVGFLAGLTTASASPISAIVSAAGFPIVARSLTTGQYTLAAPAGGVSITASVPQTPLATTVTANVTASLTTPLDLSLTGQVTTATVSPANGAQAVDVNRQITITVSNAIAASSVQSATLALTTGTTTVPTRTLLSASGQTLSVIPAQPLAFATDYTFAATGLKDTVGGDIVVPSVTFHTKDFVAPVHNFDNLTFSMPNDGGLVTVSAPAGTFAPSTTILIIDSTNGAVISLTAMSDGSVAPLLIPAALGDEMVITITDPNGNATTFKRSKFVAADGTTAIGKAGGTVTAADGSGVEVRIPEGALDRPVSLRITSVGEDAFPQSPQIPSAHFGRGIKIESADKPIFKKEVRYAFPLPDFTAVSSDQRPDDPKDAYYYVSRMINLPAGETAFQTLDWARVEGTGADAKVVMQSYPMSGAIDNYDSYNPASGWAFPVGASYAIMQWTFNRLLPGTPTNGVITGVVTRPVYAPGQATPTNKGVGGLSVRTVKGTDACIAAATVLPIDPACTLARPTSIAITQDDGRYTVFDDQFLSGPVAVVAIDESGSPYVSRTYALELTNSKFQTDPGLINLVQFGQFQNIAEANVLLPAAPRPRLTSTLDIVIREDGKSETNSGFTTVGTPLVIGFKTSDPNRDFVVQSATINGEQRTVRQGGVDDVPLTFLLSDLFTPDHTGTYTIVATAVAPFGGTVTATRTLRVVAAVDTVDNDPDNPPSVVYVLPKPPADGVPAANIPLDILPEIHFSEPVRHVNGQVTLSWSDTDGGVHFVPVTLSGVGPNPPGPINAASDEQLVTVVTVEPHGLSYGQTYTLTVLTGVQDDDQPTHRQLATPFKSSFTTFLPAPVGDHPGAFGSGLAVLGDRAYLAETLSPGGTANASQKGRLRGYDLSDVSQLRETIVPADPINFPPQDLAAGSILGSDNQIRKRVAVATFPKTRYALQGEDVYYSELVSSPANVLVYDVTNDVSSRPQWIGAASLTQSLLDGVVRRIVLKDNRVYAATWRKGVQVVDLTAVGTGFTPGGYSMLNGPFDAAFNTLSEHLDNTGANQAAVQTLAFSPDLSENVAYFPTDIKVGDFTLQNYPQVVAFTTGQTSSGPKITLVSQTPDSVRTITLPNGTSASTSVLAQSVLTWPRTGSVTAQLVRGQALALAKLFLPGVPGDTSVHDIAVVAGYGTISSRSAVLLAVVDVNDPANPQVLAMPALDGLTSVGDVVISGSTAIISSAFNTPTGPAVTVDLSDPANPIPSATLLHQIGSRLAITDSNILISGDQYPYASCPAGYDANGSCVSPPDLSGVHATSLACPVIGLETPKVVFPITIDPRNGNHYGERAKLRFKLCSDSDVTLALSAALPPGVNLPLMGTIDKGTQPVDLMSQPLHLAAGEHAIGINSTDLGPSFDIVPFSLKAKARDTGRSKQVDGQLIPDILNRSMLPVGHVFVKGVDVWDGHLTLQATDIKLSGRRLSLEMTRSYSSASRFTDSRAGASWAWTYQSSIRKNDQGQYVLQTADGSSQVFGPAPDFAPQPGYHGKLKSVNGGFQFTDKSGQVSIFRKPVVTDYEDKTLRDSDEAAADSRWRLEEIQVPHGDQQTQFDKIKLEYGLKSSAFAVTRVGEYLAESSDTPVRWLDIEYTHDLDEGNTDAIHFLRLARITSSVGHKAEYQYDGDGNLKHATVTGDIGYTSGDDQKREYIYGYKADSNDPHQLISAKDPRGNETIYDYHSHEGNNENNGVRLVRNKDEYVKLVHEADGSDTTFDFNGLIATVTDGRHNATQYVYDLSGGLEIDEPGRHSNMHWTPDILKDYEIDGNGRRTDFTYDPSNGNLLKETVHTADLGDVVTQYTGYDPKCNKLLGKIDAERHQTTYAIDRNTCDLTGTLDGAGNQTKLDYNGPHGELSLVTDARQNKTSYSNFDPFGQPQTIVDPVSTHQLTYDQRGRKTSEDDGRGHVTTWDGYNGFDQVTSVRRKGDLSPDEVTKTTYYPSGEVHVVTRVAADPGDVVTTTDLDNMNRVKTVTTTGPRLGPDGVSVSMTYDENGNKQTETDARGVKRHFTYDALNRLTDVAIDAGPFDGPLGAIAHYTYDLVANRLTETDTLSNLPPTKYIYDGLYHLTSKTLPELAPQNPADPASTLVPIVETYVYDRIGQRRSITDPNGHKTSYDYDGLGRVTLVTNPKGYTVTTEYNDPETGAHLNKSAETVRKGGSVPDVRTVFTYDAIGRELTRTVTGVGLVPHTTTTGYADPARTITITDDLGVNEVVQDGLGRVVTSTVGKNGSNLVTQTSYDALGNRKSVTDPRGNTTGYAYDGLGRLRVVTDPAPFDSQTTKTDYDGGSSLVHQEVDRWGVAKTMTYDNLGRLRTTVMTPSLSGVPWNQTITYDDPGRKQTVVTNDQSVVSDLDGLNRVKAIHDTDVVGGPATKYVRTFTLDAVGNKLSETDRNGNLTSYGYDDLDRVVKVSPPSPPVDPPYAQPDVTTSYDDVTHTQTVTDRRGIATATVSDALGRVSTVTRAGVQIENNSYDARGRKTLTRDGESHPVAFVYDDADRLISRREGDPSTGDLAPDQPFFTYDYSKYKSQGQVTESSRRVSGRSVKVYDELGRLKVETNGEAESTFYGYTPGQNSKSVTLGGKTTTYAYDEMDKLLLVTQPGNIPTSYKYDPNRNRVLQTDANNNPTQMTYDGLNRLATLVQPGRLTTIHGYDPNGNETSLFDPKQQQVSSHYDELNRLQSKEYIRASGDLVVPWQSLSRVDYTYDANGNVRKEEEFVSIAGGAPQSRYVTTRQYESFDRLLSEQTTLADTLAPSIVSYTYYNNGARKTMTAGDQTTTYSYDTANRLRGVQAGSDVVASYAYYPDSLPQTVTYPLSGVTATYVYDKADRIKSLQNASASSLISSYVYEYRDDRGNRTSQTETNGGVVERTAYGYDDLNRLKVVDYPVDGTFPHGREVTYGYDNVGNRTSETTKDLLTQTVLNAKTVPPGGFDALNRLRHLDEAIDADHTRATDFSYDHDGNTTQKTVTTTTTTHAADGSTSTSTATTTTTYTYDVRDKQVEVKQDGAILGQYVYDASGRLTKSLDDQGPRQIVYDQTSRLLELDLSGAPLERYDYGNRLIRVSGVDGQRYYSFDGLGSPTALTDEIGATKAAYHFSAWGEYRNPSELTGDNRVGFTGYRYSQSTGLYFANARWYDSSTGRFTTQDDFSTIKVDLPPSLHLYFYANDNPTRYVDPTGHFNVVGDYATSTFGTWTNTAVKFAWEFDKGGMEFFANAWTLGGYGGAKAAYQHGQGLTGAALGSGSGVLNTLTVGGYEGFGQGYKKGGVLGGVIGWHVGQWNTLLPIPEIQTFRDSRTSGWARAEAIATGTVKIASLGLVAAGALAPKAAPATVVSEVGSTGPVPGINAPPVQVTDMVPNGQGTYVASFDSEAANSTTALTAPSEPMVDLMTPDAAPSQASASGASGVSVGAGVDFGSIPLEHQWRYERYLEGPSAKKLSPNEWYAKAQVVWQNNAGGNAFEQAVRQRLGAPLGKGSKPLSIEGFIPDLPVGERFGVTDVKNWIELTDSPQMRAFYRYAEKNKLRFNAVIGPRTQSISAPLLDNIRKTGGSVTSFDPATGSFEAVDVGSAGPWRR